MQVNPETFIDTARQLPPQGRGAWTRAGIGDDYRYHRRPAGEVRVGNEAERSLDHWAVSAGVWAIQARLDLLGFLEGLPAEKRGIYNSRTRQAVIAFQRANNLEPDGIVGRIDARTLWTPIIDRWTASQQIPDRLLRGKVNHESAIDPGAIGYFIYYDREGTIVYGGVDRGLAQINSKAQPQIGWRDAYEPWESIEWSARRLRTSFAAFTRDYPHRPVGMRWDAAVCAHNSPARAREWLETGAPSPEAAAYVAAVKAARY
jgi:hypothetical protein